MSKPRADAQPLKTRLHAYRFDTYAAVDAQAWDALRDRLIAQGYHCHESWGVKGCHHDVGTELEGEVTLETSYLFNNQWFSPKHRVFDWALDAAQNKRIKQGYYLEMTPEMKALRDEVTKCGYCGAYGTVTDGPDFCDQCYTSEYLKETDLKLTRMRPVSQERNGFPELTEEEKRRLTLVYVKGQKRGNTARAIRRHERMVARVHRDYENRIKDADRAKANALIEYQAELWLLDHGITPELMDNMIWYSHTQRFCFGWRAELTREQTKQLIPLLVGFEHPYDVKSECTQEELLGISGEMK